MTIEHFLYVTEIDISIDNGPGINEREGVDAFLKIKGNPVTCLVPYPEYPAKYFNNKVVYTYPHRSNWMRYLVYMMASLVQIYKINRRHPLDAVVFRLGMTPFVPWIVSFLLKKPVILKTLAGHSLFEIKQRPLGSRLIGMATYGLMLRFIRSCHAADTVSMQYLRWIRETYGIASDRMAHIPNGANTRLFRPANADKNADELISELDYVLGYVGALEDLRHVEELISIIGTLEHLGRVGLILIGDGSQRPALEERVTSLGLGERIIFTGNVSYSEVPDYMNRFDIAFDLSLVPLHFRHRLGYTSFSQKIPQYLAVGVPVITWDTPDTRFLDTAEIGKCVTFGNREELSAAIVSLLSLNVENRQRIHRRARQYALRHFSTDVLALKRLAFWKDTL